MRLTIENENTFCSTSFIQKLHLTESINMKSVILNLLLLCSFFLFTSCGKAIKAESIVESKDSQTRLLEGNQRYLSGKQIKSRSFNARRTETGQTQKPFAIILSCADSRVPPEIIFDQGLGDLFVIRIAGNIVTDEVLASIEYAVEHLHVKFIMVLGHERCGAVGAAVKGGPNHSGHLETLIRAINPAVEDAKEQPGDLLDNAVKSNANLVAKQLNTSEPILKEIVKKGKLKIVSARYDLDDGKVEILN
jgi:carbonic anhydrase